MRILVLSDSHGRSFSLRNAILDQAEARNIIFLGDGVREMEKVADEFQDLKVYMVRGNCDYSCSEPEEMLTEIGGKRIFFTHGHKYSVKSGTGVIASAAKRFGADICLYGHTHEPYTVYDDGLYIMNPGTASGARTGLMSYGIIDITESGIMCFTVNV